MSENVLVVAFDGLDHNLIEKYGARTLKQTEFGTVNVTENVYKRMTSELFTSMITGVTYRQHGVKGLNKKNFQAHLLDTLFPFKARVSVPGVEQVYTWLEDVIRAEKRKPTREDIRVPTLFEKIPGSKPLFVPGYNPEVFWKYGLKSRVLEKGGSFEEVEQVIRAGFERRKETFFDELRSAPYQLLMCHFHYPDYMHHLYGTELSWDNGKLEELYNEMDGLAAQIKQEAKRTGYDTVLFMSDHGLPSGDSHNPNSFYSFNKSTLSRTSDIRVKPDITDFHDLILDLTGTEDKIRFTAGNPPEAEDDAEQEIRDRLRQLGY